MAASDGTEHLTTDELFRRHADFVARFLARLGVPSAQLEDALQEVFLVAHRNGGYRPGLAKPTSYLASIAIRAAARHRQRDGVARTRHSEAAVDEMASEHEDPARALQVRQDLQRLQLALERLPQELCTTLLLVEMEGESCVSVAAALSCPVGTIYWRLHQARKELRAALQSVDLSKQGSRREQPELDQRAQPARSWMMLFGLDGFKDSEASRLLQLAREQPTSELVLEQLLARHRELIGAGAELPAWASGLAPHSASLFTVLGAGPIAAGFAAGGAIAAMAVIALQSPSQPAREPTRVRATQGAPTANIASQARTLAPPARSPAQDGARSPAQPQPAPELAQTAQLRDGRVARAPRGHDADRVRARAEARTGRTDETIARTANDANDAKIANAERPAPREREARSQREQARATEQKTVQPKPERGPDPMAAASQRMGRAMTDAELAEMREIARAERLLSDDPRRALALTRALEAGFPEGRFREERVYLEVMALAELRRTGELREKAAAFLRLYPAGLYSDRVRRAVAGKED